MTATAYATGASSTMSDFVTALFSFATTNGWTQLDLDTANGEASMHIGTTLFAQFRWATSSPTSLALYQALGFGHGLAVVDSVAAGGTGYAVDDVLTLSGGSPTTAATVRVLTAPGGVVATVEVLSAGIDYGSTPSDPVSTTGGAGTGCTLNCTFRGTIGSTLPGESCDDSGSGIVTGTDATLSDLRGLADIGSGPYSSHHFFAGTNAAGDPYLHVVIEFSSGVARHMGIGHIEKIGNWKGGEYCYGSSNSGASLSTPSTSLCMLDGLFASTGGNTEHRTPTIRMEGFLDQDAAGKWGALWVQTSSSGFLDDSAGNDRQRVQGGYRAGPIAAGLGWNASNVGTAFVPMYDIVCMYWDNVSSPNKVAFMGAQPDVKGVNVKAFTFGEVVTIGSEDWMLFPMSRKGNTGDSNDSLNAGVAYLRP